MKNMDFTPLPIEHSNHAITISQQSLIVVVFANSKSSNLSAALHLASQASTHAQIDIEGALFHLVSFSKNISHTSLAITMLHLVIGWKGTHVFVGGRSSHEISKVIGVLHCYQTALRCNDHTAHCHISIRDQATAPTHNHQEGFFSSLFGSKANRIPTQSRIIHPCRYIAQHYDAKLDPNHSATLENQLQAHAVRYECEWCPLFSIDNLKKYD